MGEEAGDRIDDGSTMDQTEQADVGCRSGSSLGRFERSRSTRLLW